MKTRNVCFSIALLLLVACYNLSIMAGGGFPYTVHNSKVKFLIGKERANGQWSDFGGSRNLLPSGARENTDDAAKREFGEETKDLFGNGSRANSNKLFDQFKHQRFNHPLKKYASFLIKTPYVEEYKFTQARGDNEKTEFAWVDAEEFLNAVERRGKQAPDTAFSIGSKEFRPFFIDTIQHNLSGIRQAIRKEQQPIKQITTYQPTSASVYLSRPTTHASSRQYPAQQQTQSLSTTTSTTATSAPESATIRDEINLIYKLMREKEEEYRKTIEAAYSSDPADEGMMAIAESIDKEKEN